MLACTECKIIIGFVPELLSHFVLSTRICRMHSAQSFGWSFWRNASGHLRTAHGGAAQQSPSTGPVRGEGSRQRYRQVQMYRDTTTCICHAGLVRKLFGHSFCRK